MMSKSFTHIGAGVVIAEKYKLERKLGEGSMGVVWAAVNVTTAREVAIKLLNSPHPELRRRLQREGRNSGALRHRNIIDLYDMGETEGGEPFLVMQLLTGETVAELLERRRRLDADVAAAIGRDVARGLTAAHAEHIVHRDLKPANIFLHCEPDVDEPVVKVLDFGVAKNLAANDGIRTATGGAVGSPLYMSPEQVRAEPNVDHRADIWALGVVMFEMLTGMRPFQGDARAVFTGILNGEIPRVSRYLRKVDPALVELVARCMRRGREERIGSAAEVAELLDEFLSTGTVAAMTAGQEGVVGGRASAMPMAATPMPSPPMRGSSPSMGMSSPPMAVSSPPMAVSSPSVPMPGPALSVPALSVPALSVPALPVNGDIAGHQAGLPGGAAADQGWNPETTQKLDLDAMTGAEPLMNGAPARGQDEAGRSTTASLVSTPLPGPGVGPAAQGQPSPWGVRPAAPSTPPQQQQGASPWWRQLGTERIPRAAAAALAAGAALVVGAALYFGLRGSGEDEVSARPEVSPEAGVETGASSASTPRAAEPPAAQTAQAPAVQAAPTAPAPAAPESPKADVEVDAGAAVGSERAGAETPAPSAQQASAAAAPAAPAAATATATTAAAPPRRPVAEPPAPKPTARTAAPSPPPPAQTGAKRTAPDPCAGKTGFIRTNCLRTQERKKDPYAP
ncbi:uncharacterized protein SOCE26_021130 [Sorangium cellulosum]|uniref:Protein kinase domain-containing protein n=1 Tax=Sorangium cellulosum TaxID=56 RepID=A0A2L0EN80_SORCE|nr:serine/threonine-protein kinase [Sorangium cellulosum]AUX40712.1 uncharacterized protein SOCE26_021130 [Sorangium cellulosum]